MNKIILSILFLLIIPFAGVLSGCGATSGGVGSIKSNNPQSAEMSLILQKKTISYADIKIINKLVGEHAAFNIADLRRLIRDYRGNKGKYIPGHTNYKNHFLPVSADIERIGALAYVVNKILKNYKNVYDNINAQGQHYQTALFIACRLHETRIINALLKDKKINIHITSLGHMINMTDHTLGYPINGFPLWTVVSMYPIRAYEFSSTAHYVSGVYTIKYPKGLCKGYKKSTWKTSNYSFIDDCESNPTVISDQPLLSGGFGHPVGYSVY